MRAIKHGNEIRIEDGYSIKESIKEIPGRHYDAATKAWYAPCSQENAALIQILGAQLDGELSALVRPVREVVTDAASVYQMPIRTEPYSHQIRAFKFAMDKLHSRSGTPVGVAYLMDMGTGKSLTTIAVAGALYQNNEINRLLIVCPKSITGVWETEFLRFADFRYSLVVLEGGSAKSVKLLHQLGQKNGLTSRCEAAVINYESCWRLEAEIAKWKPDMIVCDESSKIKNPQAKQSKALHRLGRQSKFNFILTGTPINNNPLDFFSQYKFLDESIFGPSFYRFRSRYAIIGGYGNHRIVGYRNMPELVEKAHSIAFRVRIEEAVDLPPYIDETRNITLETSAKGIYDAIDKQSYAELMAGEVTATNILTRLLRLSQCTGGFIRSDAEEKAQNVSTAKLDALEDILDECMEQGKKVVVFARFIPEITAIEKLLQAKKIGYSVIHGGISDRAEQVERFQTDDKIRVFVGQLQTTGMGLTLTAASVAVYYSLDYSYANYKQSRARIHRIGQTKKTLYIHLVAKGTVDEKIMDALKHKGDIAKLLVDEWRQIKANK